MFHRKACSLKFTQIEGGQEYDTFSDLLDSILERVQ